MCEGVCKKSSIELVSIFGDFELELNYCSLLVPNSERERGSALVIEHAPNLELACMSGWHVTVRFVVLSLQNKRDMC